MRFLHISGPGVMPHETFCPNCHVLLDDRDGYKLCICAPMTRVKPLGSGVCGGTGRACMTWKAW